MVTGSWKRENGMLNWRNQTWTNVKSNNIFIFRSYHHLYAVHNDSPAPFRHKPIAISRHTCTRNTFHAKPESVIRLPFLSRTAVSRIAFCFIEDAADHTGKRLNTRWRQPCGRRTKGRQYTLNPNLSLEHICLNKTLFHILSCLLTRFRRHIAYRPVSV